ncbi:MAG: IS110 family transposase [Pirellulaceae bacterium]
MKKSKPPENFIVPTADSATLAEAVTIISIGIDWADREHTFAATLPDGTVEEDSFKHNPAAIKQWINHFQKRFPQATLDICVETSRGALINALVQFDGVAIYPVNPYALSSYRKAFAHGGGKTDPVDAKLIMQFLTQHKQVIRPLKQNSPLTRELDALTKHRRGLVEQRVDLSNQLNSLLKDYFPALIELGAAKPYAVFILAILMRWPTLAQLQKAGPAKLRKLLLGLGTKARIEQRIESLMRAIPLSTDEVLLRTNARLAQAIAAQLQLLNKSIKEYDLEIKRLVQTHDDFAIFESLPGASDKTQARMIAAMGDDRARYDSPESLQAAAGIAPLTIQSGRSRLVTRRWASTTFMMQTFHEYAGLSIRKCQWAKAYYESQLAKGKSANTAKRALAYKWLRIIHRCWITRTPYNESRYIERLAATRSPLFDKIKAA